MLVLIKGPWLAKAGDRTEFWMDLKSNKIYFYALWKEVLYF